jgi:hypothetical protein
MVDGKVEVGKSRPRNGKIMFLNSSGQDFDLKVIKFHVMSVFHGARMRLCLKQSLSIYAWYKGTAGSYVLS